MRNLLLGFLLGVVVATAGFTAALVGAQGFGQGVGQGQGFMDLESGTMYQPVPGGLLNLQTGELRLTAPLGTPQPGHRQPC